MLKLDKLQIDSSINSAAVYNYFLCLNDLHRYNRLVNNGINIGNLGLPVLELSLDTDFFYKVTDFNLSLFNLPKANNVFLKSKKPLTDFFYVTGSFKEQYLNLIHIQPIAKGVSFFVGYNKIKSEGFYKNQLTDNNAVYTGIELRYRSFFSSVLVNYNSQGNGENGGISEDSLFKINFYTNSRLYNVNLYDAKNLIKGYDIAILNGINLKSDTISLKYILYHKLSYNSYKRKYLDNPNNFFYSNILLDSNNTSDEYFYNSFKNELGLNFSGNHFSMNLSFLSSISDYRNIIDTSTHDVGSSFLIGYKTGRFKANIIGEYFFAGYKADNYILNAHIGYDFKSFIENIKITLNTSNLSPGIDYIYINTNNYYWSNSFDNTKLSNLKLTSNFKSKFKIESQYCMINNFIYLNRYAFPNQSDTPTSYLKFSLDKEFDYKYFAFRASTIYQKVVNGEHVLRFPEYIINASICYKNKLWSMKYQIGTQVFYYSSFFSNSYNPALNSFYLQNDFITGGYPYFDIFFKASIKNVKLLLMISHVNQGFSGTNYFSTLSYPMPGRAFKIGLNWTFIN